MQQKETEFKICHNRSARWRLPLHQMPGWWVGRSVACNENLRPTTPTLPDVVVGFKILI